MSAILNPHTGKPVTAGPPELILPPAVAASQKKPEIVLNDLRSTRDWQSLLVGLQSRVREHFLTAFAEDIREKMDRRLCWQVHEATCDELGTKLGDELEIRGHNVFLYGWPLDISAVLAPGAVRVTFIVMAEVSTPEFIAHLKKLRAAQADKVGHYTDKPATPDANAP